MSAAIIESVQPNPLNKLIESGELRPAQGRLPLVSSADDAERDSAGLDAVLDDRYDEDRS